MEAASKRVTFPSRDGKTDLVGYLFPAKGATDGMRPAVVMMHGRAGAYSPRAGGRYDETTLSRRQEAWGEYWADQGYVALLVDSFGARGHARGFPILCHEKRPEAASAVRALDAYGALLFLRAHDFVDPERIALQGWSSGAAATLAAMSEAMLNESRDRLQTGFAGPVAFYPACGLDDRHTEQGARPYAPVLVFSGDPDAGDVRRPRHRRQA